MVHARAAAQASPYPFTITAPLPQLRFSYFGSNTDFASGTLNYTKLGSVQTNGEIDANGRPAGWNTGLYR